VDQVFSKTLFWIGSIPVEDIVVHTWIVMAVILPLAYLAGQNLRIRPKSWQGGIEMFTDYVSGLIAQRTTRHVSGLFELATTMMLYVAIANLLGLVPGFRSPTRSLNTTLALSLVSLISVHYFGVRSQGVAKYLRSFVEPIAISFIVLPLNIMGEISRLVSMALRLFGNIVSGEIIGAVISSLIPVGVPLVFSALGSITGVLQALVFTYLTIVFILGAVGDEEMDEPAAKRATANR
jgi:F-type H+-transporting ATPase subunit a